jgi:hypothetical protein
MIVIMSGRKKYFFAILSLVLLLSSCIAEPNTKQKEISSVFLNELFARQYGDAYYYCSGAFKKNAPFEKFEKLGMIVSSIGEVMGTNIDLISSTGSAGTYGNYQILVYGIPSKIKKSYPAKFTITSLIKTRIIYYNSMCIQINNHIESMLKIHSASRFKGIRHPIHQCREAKAIHNYICSHAL